LWHCVHCFQCLDGTVGERLDASIAGIHRRVAVSYPDDGLFEITVFESDGS